MMNELVTIIIEASLSPLGSYPSLSIGTIVFSLRDMRNGRLLILLLLIIILDTNINTIININVNINHP